jgi:hypothetical protein
VKRAHNTPPHDYQRLPIGATSRLDPCAYPGCLFYEPHAIHHADNEPARDITEPVHPREERQP